MKDNFDLKKFLLENKTMENSNPYSSTANKKNNITEGNLRDKVREMILKEIGGDDLDPDFDETELEDFINPGNTEEEALDRKNYLDKFDEPDFLSEDEEEDDDSEEADEEETEDAPVEDDDEAAFGTIAADMEGSESEIMDNLMAALKAAKEVGNEKLSTQIGNTLKFFVSEFIGGGEQ
jgi:hypothetical protein